MNKHLLRIGLLVAAAWLSLSAYGCSPDQQQPSPGLTEPKADNTNGQDGVTTAACSAGAKPLIGIVNRRQTPNDLCSLGLDRLALGPQSNWGSDIPTILTIGDKRYRINMEPVEYMVRDITFAQDTGSFPGSVAVRSPDNAECKAMDVCINVHRID